MFKLDKNKMENSDLRNEQIASEVSTHFLNTLGRDIDKKTLEYFLTEIKTYKSSLKEVKDEITYSYEAMEIKVKNFQDVFPIFPTKYPKDEIKKMLSLVPQNMANTQSNFYHSFKFGNVAIEDARTAIPFQMWIAQKIPLDLSNKSVLDIGKADGFYSFLCEHRHAKRVLAIDNGYFPAFDIVKKILDSKVDFLPMDLYDIDKLNEMFDYILCFGVYYHLNNPVLALKKMFDKVNDTVFLSGHVLLNDAPIMCLYDEYELHPQDPTNWWVASPSCLMKMAKRVGFKKCELIDIVKQPLPWQKTDNKLEKVFGIGLFQFSK